jgi:hypothetical protein
MYICAWFGWSRLAPLSALILPWSSSQVAFNRAERSHFDGIAVFVASVFLWKCKILFHLVLLSDFSAKPLWNVHSTRRSFLEGIRLHILKKVARFFFVVPTYNIPKGAKIYQLTTKYTNFPQNVPNGHYMCQMTVKYIKHKKYIHLPIKSFIRISIAMFPLKTV